MPSGPKKPRKPRTEKKQQAFLRKLAVSDTIEEAGKGIYSEGSAARRAYATIKNRMPQILENLGVTDELIVTEVIIPGLKANKTTFFHKNGIVMETRVTPDMAERRAMGRFVAELKGQIKPSGTDEGDSQPGAITINLGVLQSPATAVFLASAQESKRPLVLDELHQDRERIFNAKPRQSEPKVPAT
jgi:hypothetical protein